MNCAPRPATELNALLGTEPNVANSRPTPLRRAVFLDRDGTINVDPGYLNDPSRVELIPGVASALRRIQGLGFDLLVVTNQSGIGRGVITAEQLDAVHTALDHKLAGFGVWIHEYAICPHRPEAQCSCRKPEPQLLLALAAKHRIDLSQSYMVGDRVSDVECGFRAGVRTCLLVEPRTCHGELTAIGRFRAFVAASFSNFADALEQVADRADPPAPTSRMNMTSGSTEWWAQDQSWSHDQPYDESKSCSG